MGGQRRALALITSSLGRDGWAIEGPPPFVVVRDIASWKVLAMRMTISPIFSSDGKVLATVEPGRYATL